MPWRICSKPVIILLYLYLRNGMKVWVTCTSIDWCLHVSCTVSANGEVQCRCWCLINPCNVRTNSIFEEVIIYYFRCVIVLTLWFQMCELERARHPHDVFHIPMRDSCTHMQSCSRHISHHITCTFASYNLCFPHPTKLLFSTWRWIVHHLEQIAL